MSALSSQITGVSIVYSTVCSGEIKKNIKVPRYWPLWGERASNAENIPTWWRHHDMQLLGVMTYYMATLNLSNLLCYADGVIIRIMTEIN